MAPGFGSRSLKLGLGLAAILVEVSSPSGLVRNPLCCSSGLAKGWALRDGCFSGLGKRSSGFVRREARGKPEVGPVFGEGGRWMRKKESLVAGGSYRVGRSNEGGMGVSSLLREIRLLAYPPRASERGFPHVLPRSSVNLCLHSRVG